MAKIGEVLSREEWILALKKRLGDKSKFEIMSVDWGVNSDELIGFLGDHFQVKLGVLTGGQNQQEMLNYLNFFIKILPRGSDFRSKFINNSDAYPKEVGVYSSIFEGFRKYGLIPNRNDGSPWAPECYYTRPDIVVLENLVADGFRMFNKYELMDMDHIKLMLSALARFHAASIIYEDKETENTGKICKLNDLYPNVLHEVIFLKTGKSPLKDSFQTGVNSLLAILAETEKYGVNSEHFNKISDVFQEKQEMICDYIKPSEKYRNVICHGDLWPNNMMFRYGAENNKPEECRLIDFQIARYAPPAVDVMMFLHMVTSRDYRKEHLETMLQEYYTQLTSELERHEVSSFSWEEFHESCVYYTPTALINAGGYHAAIFIPESVLSKEVQTDESFEKFMLRDRDEVTLRCFREVQQFRERLTEDLEAFVECVVLETASV